MMRSTNRRRFLKQTAASAGAFGVLGVIPSTVLAKDGAPGPNDKIQIGCIGVGGMGNGNMGVFLGLPNCKVVAVCDVREERRNAAKNRVEERYQAKGCATYADYRGLLARKDIDAVMIAVQDHWHALVATAAAKAGKDMYCEKPLGVSVEESRTIRDVVRKTGRVFQTGTWQRSQGKFQQACRLVRNGYLGKISSVEVSAPGSSYKRTYKGSLDPQPVPASLDWKMWQGPASEKPFNPGRICFDWYFIWDYCAGFTTNWGVHHLDIANWGCPQIGAEPFEVECKATYRNDGFTDNVDSWDSTLTYAGGFKVRFTDTAFQKPGCRFVGERGWVYVDRSGIWAEPESLLKVKFKPEDNLLTNSNHHQDDLLECIRSRKDPVSSVDAAHQASILGMITDIAGRLKQKLRWDPKAERFVGNDEANKMLTRPMHNGWNLQG